MNLMYLEDQWQDYLNQQINQDFFGMYGILFCILCVLGFIISCKIKENGENKGFANFGYNLLVALNPFALGLYHFIIFTPVIVIGSVLVVWVFYLLYLLVKGGD